MYATIVMGAEARVLTNDAMRDHAPRGLEGIAHDYFVRWKVSSCPSLWLADGLFVWL